MMIGGLNSLTRYGALAADMTCSRLDSRMKTVNLAR